jgi:hypothetical protein
LEIIMFATPTAKNETNFHGYSSLTFSIQFPDKERR